MTLTSNKIKQPKNVVYFLETMGNWPVQIELGMYVH